MMNKPVKYTYIYYSQYYLIHLCKLMNIINILVHRCKCITEMVQDDALLIIYKAWPYFVNYISTPIDYVWVTVG